MPEIDGNKKVTLEELKLVHDLKLDKDFSGLTALPQSPANGDTLVVQSNNTNYKIDYSALASAIISQLGTSGVVSIAHGGTGSTTAANALTALGAVSGVKGNSESTYRNGNVNITAANIGALTSSDIVNDLTSTDPTKALAAPQGKALYDIITNKQTNTQTSDGVNCKYVVRSGYCYIGLTGRPTTTDNITFTVPMALVGAYLTCGQWGDSSHHMQVFIDNNTNVIIIRNHSIDNINVSIVYPVG